MLTSDVIAGAAGIALSLLFSFTPGLAQWFAAKDGTVKRLFMLGAVVLVAIGALALACANIQGLPFAVACTQTGIVGLVQAVIVCLMANQATDRITPNIGPGKTPDTVKVPVMPGDMRSLSDPSQAAAKGP